MGLFDRWRAPGGTASPTTSTWTSDGEPPPPEPEHEDPFFDDLVRTHMARLESASEDAARDIDPQEFLAALTTRLAGQDSLPDEPRFHYITPFAPHIAEVLTLDLPSAVVTLPEERLVATGRHHGALVARGRTNLAKLMESSDAEVTRLGGSRQSCLAIVGDSPYTASFARFLTEAVSRWIPDADTGNGVVFALPHRNAIVLQTCTTPAETRAALELVPGHARQLFEASSSPVSPHVYHWYHREISCLTTEVEDGSLALTTTPLIDSMLGRSSRQAG